MIHPASVWHNGREADLAGLQGADPVVEKLTWCNLHVADATWQQGELEALLGAHEGTYKVHPEALERAHGGVDKGTRGATKCARGTSKGAQRH